MSNDLLKLNNGLVDIEKVRVLNNKKHKKLCRLQIYIDDFFQPFRVFDMRKFQQNVNRELRRATPDRLRYADDDDNGDDRVGNKTVDEEEEE